MEYAWRPHPGPQEEFCKRGEFECFFGGAKGPGKTDCLIMEATRYISYPRYKGLILRKTFPRLQEIIDRCWSYYPLLGGIYKSTEHRWYFPGGATIALGHVQHEEDKRNYHGKEFHYVGFDELTEFEKSQYLFIVANVRKSSEGPELRIRSSSNPGGPGHVWVKDYFVDRCPPGDEIEYIGLDGTVKKMRGTTVYIDPNSYTSRSFVPATVYDNPSIMLYDPGYVRRLESLSPIEKKRFLYGEWDAFEGQVFSELNKAVHMCEPFQIPAEWEKFMSFDWGYSKPFSVGWYALDFDGVLYRYREYYGCKNDEPDVGLRITPQDIAREIYNKEREKISFRVADPACWSKRPLKGGVMGPSVIEDMTNEGLYFLKADNNRLLGKMQVHQRLKVQEEIEPTTGEVIEQRPMFQAFSDSIHFWRTMPEMRQDFKNPEDVDSASEDHIYDEFRYACMSRPLIPKRIDKIPSGSFQATRQRYIKAKKYAQRHGVSIEAAYNRVR